MASIYKTYYDVNRIVIWGDSPSEDGKRARLTFGFRDGNPRFTVNTGTPGVGGMINFPCDNFHMVTCMNLLKDVASGSPGIQRTIDSLAPVYVDNKPTIEKRVVGTLIFGKTKEGIVYITVVATDRPKIVFPIKQSDFHIVRDENKQIVPESVVSEKMAIGIANLVLEVVAKMIVKYNEEEYDQTGRKPAPLKAAGGGTATSGQKDVMDKFQDLDSLSI